MHQECQVQSPERGQHLLGSTPIVIRIAGLWSSRHGSAETNLTSAHEDAGSIPGLAVGYRSGVAVSCGVGHRCGSDPALLWLWYRPVAAAPIQPLAWEPPYAMGADLKRPKTKQNKTKQNKTKHVGLYS